jgi:hypothetical protein
VSPTQQTQYHDERKKGERKPSGRDLKLNTDLYLVPRLGMHGALSPFPLLITAINSTEHILNHACFRKEFKAIFLTSVLKFDFQH